MSNDCFDYLRDILSSKTKIFVTGSERSGTRITARIIADIMDFKYIDEGFPHCKLHNDWETTIKDHSKFVLQCPRHSSCCHRFCFDEEVLIVFCRRDLDEIIASQKRIGWRASKKEYDRYIKQFPKLFAERPDLLDLHISELKYLCWDDIQKPMLHDDFYYDCYYGSLNDHRFWKQKDRRKGFKWNQWK
jgi:hypothetical protein